jgi:hypothetical protein
MGSDGQSGHYQGGNKEKVVAQKRVSPLLSCIPQLSGDVPVT